MEKYSMYNVKNFGAVADGVTVNTNFIQKAVDECCANGGGRVTVPPGIFVTGTVWLKDNVELYLEHGAVLKGSADTADYNADDAYLQNYGSIGEQWTAKHLIIAHEVKNLLSVSQKVSAFNNRTVVCNLLQDCKVRFVRLKGI